MCASQEGLLVPWQDLTFGAIPSGEMAAVGRARKSLLWQKGHFLQTPGFLGPPLAARPPRLELGGRGGRRQMRALRLSGWFRREEESFRGD